MATINGKPSIFQTPEVPSAGITTDYETYLTEKVQFAREMVADTEPREAETDSIPEMSAEEEAHICAQYDAEVEEMKALGDGYLIGLNTNRDVVWQAGGF